jgi:hypothetical protein
MNRMRALLSRERVMVYHAAARDEQIPLKNSATPLAQIRKLRLG